MKRLLDIVLSAFGLILAGPVLIIALVLVWLQDFKSPFYIAPRAGKHNQPFSMVKIRSMVVNRSSVKSTSSNDPRITKIGIWIRRFKLDELTQLWNVLKGDMSLVGPRPQVTVEVKRYTREEMNLLSVRPGITDFSSIVFSDEGEILKNSQDPDLDYNQLIRPWKSRLGLFYIKKRTFILDIKLIALTLVAIFSRETALKGVGRLLTQLKADKMMIEHALRAIPLKPYPPPGAQHIVMPAPKTMVS